MAEPGSTDLLKEHKGGTFADKQVFFVLVVVALFAWMFGRASGENKVTQRVVDHANTCWSDTRSQVYECYVIAVGR